jgi:hypothetical protein
MLQLGMPTGGAVAERCSCGLRRADASGAVEPLSDVIGRQRCPQNGERRQCAMVIGVAAVLAVPRPLICFCCRVCVMGVTGVMSVRIVGGIAGTTVL